MNRHLLKQPMIEKLVGPPSPRYGRGIETQEQNATPRELSFLERLDLLVDQQPGQAGSQRASHRDARGLDAKESRETKRITARQCKEESWAICLHKYVPPVNGFQRRPL